MVIFTIERYSSQMLRLGQGMNELDAALVETLNREDGPELLRRLAAAVADGRMLETAELAELNEVLARTPVTARLVDGGHGRYALEMRPVGGDSERVLAGQFASLLRRAPDRLKRCEECNRFFLDSTRSRTRRWCTSRCGDRARVRSHRARRTGGR
jgi:predicted RNA-binding Zn ribbon-like protein